MSEPSTPGRIVIIPFLHGRLTADGKLSEPDIYLIVEKWFDRHPEFKTRSKEFRISSGRMHLPQGIPTDLVRVTASFMAELAEYDPAEDVDLYEDFLAKDSAAE